MKQERAPHWIKHNQQERMPPRMIALDTEASIDYAKNVETQSWGIGAAIRWRTDLKTSDKAEARYFSDVLELWQWVSSYCRIGTRTVVWCHNLGYDTRISQVFTILPKLGFRLEWCNLDRNVSSMTWRSDHGTLVFADTWTWLPMQLESIAPQVGMVKYAMPSKRASLAEWNAYCLRDAEIVYHVVSRLCGYIKSHGLGNWQPTGAGMAMATWRHRFLSHKILVHDDADALGAERAAMYTGRAEAWRHGKLGVGKWTEVDLRNAYLAIARESSLPRKLHMSTGSISLPQYHKLRDRFAVLCRASVDTTVPVLPYRDQGRILWPIGQFDGWYWDVELECAMRYGAKIEIHQTYVYACDPLLADWAEWVLGILRKDNDETDPVVKTWIKHCSRALIGRIALRTPSWEAWGDNPEGITGITYVTMPEEGYTTRMLHVGSDTLIETHRMEGKDSLPQITGRIMATCRVWLWEGMNVAGTENIAHVDTDSLLANSAGLARMRDRYGSDFDRLWQLKGTYTRLEVFGPRAYRRDGSRVVAGIPKKAHEEADGSLSGETWASLSSDLTEHAGGVVTIRPATWHIPKTDLRRRDASEVGTATLPYSVGGSLTRSSSERSATAEGS